MIVINASKLNDILKIVDTITTEFIVTFDDTGMHLFLGDSANVMRCFINVDKEWFVTYSPTQEKYGISLENIKNIVAKASKNSNVTFTSDSYGKKISITFVENEIVYQGVFTALVIEQMRFISNMGEKFYEAVNKTYACVSVNVGRINNVLSALSPFYSAKDDLCRDVTYMITEDGMTITSGNEFSGNMMDCNIPIRIIKEQVDTYTYPVTTRILSTYVIIMRSILGICNSDEDIMFYNKTNFPIYFKADIHDNTCHIDYICACRIAN